MKRTFTARLDREDDWLVAQCREVDVASQGRTERETLNNLLEALELWFEDSMTDEDEIVVGFQSPEGS